MQTLKSMILTAGVNTQFANNDKSAVTVSLWNAIAQSPRLRPR